MWDAYPLVANVHPTWPLDDRHATTDESNWSMVLTNSLSRRWTAEQAKAMSPDTWNALIDAVTTAPAQLHRRIEGGHMFVLGEHGARETVEATLELTAQASQLTELLDSLLASS